MSDITGASTLSRWLAESTLRPAQAAGKPAQQTQLEGTLESWGVLHVRTCSLRHSKPCHASAQTLQAAHSRQPMRSRRGGLARPDAWCPGRLGKHIVHDADEVLHREQRRLMYTGRTRRLAQPMHSSPLHWIRAWHAWCTLTLGAEKRNETHATPPCCPHLAAQQRCAPKPAQTAARHLCHTASHTREPPPLIWDLWHPMHPAPQSNRSGSACRELTPTAHGYSRGCSRLRHVRCDPGRPGSAAIVICADVITKQPTVHP